VKTTLPQEGLYSMKSVIQSLTKLNRYFINRKFNYSAGVCGVEGDFVKGNNNVAKGNVGKQPWTFLR
jgi:hypothetical protein